MRSFRLVAAALVISSICALGIAQEQPKSPVIREFPVGNLQEWPQGLKVVPAPVPKVRYARVAEQPILGVEQKQHILQAIGHLESARFTEEATRLRNELSRFELAELERQKQRKAAELQELEARIQHLQSQSWADRAITIRMSMVEISREWLEAMLADLHPGYRLEPIEKASPGAQVTMIIDDGEAVDRLIGVLSQQGVVKVLSRPVIKTLNGNPATVLVGGETPRVVPAGGKGSQIDMEWFGLKMTALPTIVDDKLIRLKLLCERREHNAESDSVKATKIQTTVELKHGQTVLLSRPNGKGDHYVLTVVKPEVNDSASGVPTVAKPRAESPYTAIPLSPRRLEPVPEPIPETAELPAPASVVR